MMICYPVTAFGQPLERQQRPLPEPKGAEVLIKTAACGVCHSDVHLWEGYFDLGGGNKLAFGGGRNVLPIVLGHEIIGTVAALGPEAQGVKLGDKRVVYPWIGCGQCSVCKSGEEQLCAKPQALGINKDGGYADHVLVPHARYLFDFAGVPDAMACTFACSGLTAYGALKKAGKLSSGDPLVIVGAGGVGLAAVRLAEAVTGVKPIVADISAAKREATLAAGAQAFFDASAPDCAKQILAATKGVAVALDFVGSETSSNLGQAILRRGGKLVIVGLFGGAFKLPVPMFVLRTITIQGSYVGSPGDMAELRELAVSGRLPPMPVAQRKLDQAGAAIADLREGKIIGRVVVAPG
ncbi:MAG: zinc-binding dehydrogenase [Alphaproteobacteria bacterium]|nr:zinc-binding dehydrogenase [Alphaproteobacteria bacterium]